MMEFEGQNNDFGGTKRYNNVPLVPLPWKPWDLILRTGGSSQLGQNPKLCRKFVLRVPLRNVTILVVIGTCLLYIKWQ